MMDDANGLHKGHRQRMREKFLDKGLEAFSDVEVLEYLLTFSIPRANTNPTAHRLLNKFESLHQILDATFEELTEVEGVGPRSAELISLFRQLRNRYEDSKVSKEKYLRTTREIGRYLLGKIGSLREERAYLLCLDPQCRIISFRELMRGTVNEINMPYRRVAEVALAVNAVTVVLAHNHPNGTSIPSADDITYTRGLMNLLQVLNVNLADHFVITEHAYTSMKSSGMMDCAI